MLKERSGQMLWESANSTHPIVHLKGWYSCEKLLQLFAVWIVVNMSLLYSDICQ